jgi:peptidoglycan/LPS O-acetylase OafA/YrhL
VGKKGILTNLRNVHNLGDSSITARRQAVYCGLRHLFTFKISAALPDGSPALSTNRQHLQSLVYFRGIAIILIVAGHCYGISGWQINSFIDRFVANLVSGGTTLFVFISGFLFHHVFYSKFRYGKFMEGKVKNVLVPYLVMSCFAIPQALYLHTPFRETYFGPTASAYDQIVRPTVLYLLTGGVFAYWYIPFIMCVFALSPLFILFIRTERRFQCTISLLFLCISLLLHRPVDNFLVLQSVLYFTPVYLIGILCSLEKELLYRTLGNRLWLLLAMSLSLAILQAATSPFCGDLQKAPLAFNGININLLQKLAFCLFLLVFLHRFEETGNKLLNTLAASSFAIYFLHGWFIYVFSLVREIYSPFHGLLLLPFVAAAVTLGSFLLAGAVKVMFQKRSRLLIGW